MAEYEVWLTNDAGGRLAHVQPYWFQATRVANGVGTFQMGVDPDFNPTWLRRDVMIQYWREPHGGRLGLFRTYFLRKWRWDLGAGGETLRLYGRDMNYLLSGRDVAYPAQSSQATKAAMEADDMMKAVVTENMVADASSPDWGSRNWSALSVAPDLGAGPQLTMSFPRKNVLDVLNDIADAAATAGTRLYFDVVESNVATATLGLQFRTYPLPGRDLTGLGVVFSPERGNLASAFLDCDYTTEVNYVYGLGQGENDRREVQESYDEEAIAASQWNRREGSINASTEDADGVLDRADAEIQKRAGTVRAGGEIRDTDAFRFGVDWHWGDKVRVMYREVEFDALVRAVSISAAGNSEEKVQATLEAV